jgi:hypothetical protein
LVGFDQNTEIPFSDSFTEFSETSQLSTDSPSQAMQSFLDRHSSVDNPSGPFISTIARIAIYDDLLSSPRIIDVEPAPLLRFIENIASETYERARQLGGRLPYSVVREIAENFIHADFKECTVSILDRGDTIRFSDRGPGIEKKLLVLQPGVTSASETMRNYIKGVGSGFPLVREYLEINQGSLRIDDNAAEGVVITLSMAPKPAANAVSDVATPPVSISTSVTRAASSAYTDQSLATATEHTLPTQQGSDQSIFDMVEPRALAALEVVADLGAAGPTDLVEPLSISAATGTRLLDKLEAAGLLEKTTNRKRILSNAGLLYLQRLTGN